MEHPRGQALLACDAVARDPNGKATVYGVFDEISAGSFPAIHPLFAVFWRCTVPGPGQVSVGILRPDGTVLTEFEPAETARPEPHTMQGTHTLGAIEFPVEGSYTLVLRFNGKELLRTMLSLIRRAEKR